MSDCHHGTKAYYCFCLCRQSSSVNAICSFSTTSLFVGVFVFGSYSHRQRSTTQEIGDDHFVTIIVALRRSSICICAFARYHIAKCCRCSAKIYDESLNFILFLFFCCSRISNCSHFVNETKLSIRSTERDHVVAGASETSLRTQFHFIYICQF